MMPLSLANFGKSIVFHHCINLATKLFSKQTSDFRDRESRVKPVNPIGTGKYSHAFHSYEHTI